MKVLKISTIIVSLYFCGVNYYAQTVLSEIPSSGKFAPEVEQIESLTDGITIYDQYSTMLKKPEVRKEGSIFIQGKIEDHYANGQLLHKGNYENGIVYSFTNYYLNETVERKYKHKKEGNGTLTSYYLNGNTRLIAKYNNYLAYDVIKFTKEEGVVYLQQLNPETGTPELVQENYENGVPKSIMELQDPEKMEYLQITYTETGAKLTEGKLEYNTDENGLLKKGEWLQYDENNNPTPLEYNFDEVISFTGDQVLQNEDEEIASNTDDSVKEENGNTTKSTSITSTIPTDLARFDQDADNKISTGELDIAVSDFFDDTSIKLDQINSLVNFFFDQD